MQLSKRIKGTISQDYALSQLKNNANCDFFYHFKSIFNILTTITALFIAWNKQNLVGTGFEPASLGFLIGILPTCKVKKHMLYLKTIYKNIILSCVGREKLN